jgi:ketosteroid isomerase-like protein
LKKIDMRGVLFAAAAGIGACNAGLAAGSGAEVAAAESAVRDADAAWVATAKARNVDAWLAFYTDDVVLLAPDSPLASGKAAARPTVVGLLTLPRLAVDWHPLKVEVAASADMAYLIGAYELHYEDPRRGAVADRGKLLEIWKRQPDGSWKCAVDTWNSDGAGTASPPAPPPAPQPATATGPLTPEELQSADYGEKPVHYEEAVRAYFRKRLRDPDTVQYGEITAPVRGYTTSVAGMIVARETRHYGWSVKATVNAKNSFGGYVGFKTYTFLFRGEKLVQTMAPLAEDEVK